MSAKAEMLRATTTTHFCTRARAPAPIIFFITLNPAQKTHLTSARMKADLPTLAAPITYTSRPRRSCRMAATASDTPAPVRALTWQGGNAARGWSTARAGVVGEWARGKGAGPCMRTHVSQPEQHTALHCCPALQYAQKPSGGPSGRTHQVH